MSKYRFHSQRNQGPTPKLNSNVSMLIQQIGQIDGLVLLKKRQSFIDLNISVIPRSRARLDLFFGRLPSLLDTSTPQIFSYQLLFTEMFNINKCLFNMELILC